MISIPHPSQIGDFVESTQKDEDRPSKRRAIDAEADDEVEVELEEEVDTNTAWSKGAVIAESECDFTSIQELRKEVGKGNQGEFTT